MFVPKIYRSMSPEDLEDYVYNEVPNMFHWEILLMIDYNNHHKDEDYGEGLSFIDRIHAKIGWFYQWDVDSIKKSIYDQKDYVYVISSMLNHEACCMYGIHDIKNGF